MLYRFSSLDDFACKKIDIVGWVEGRNPTKGLKSRNLVVTCPINFDESRV